MADTLTSKTVLNNQLRNYFVSSLLVRLTSKVPLYQLGDKAPQPKNSGDTTFWTAYVNLAGASVSLTEGAANSLPAMSSRRVSAQPVQYGRGVKISDIAQWMTQFNQMEKARELLETSAAYTLEYVAHTGIFKAAYFGSQSKTVILSALMSSLASAMCANTGTNNSSNKLFQFPAVFAGSAARLSANSASAPSQSAQLSIHAVRKAVLKLNQKDAQPFDDGYFVAYAHPNALHSLKKDQAFAEWQKYTNPEAMFKDEEGKVLRVRFVSSNLCPRYAVTAHSVNLTFIMSKQAFGITEAMGGVDYILVDTPDSNNPFNQYSTLTYKLMAAAACLNPSAGVILFSQEKA